ncbi:uncharacterized protein LOC116223088 [Clupea harengus]|uniref:Uncharacterized protein LOC116223088 n=1 Tax=Clupea harengus TaxID=7950 RepID=A0A6P8GHJ4_CLUHA|nr:uncharacterized protein LOC116223088 [Clupea harengus]
MASIPCALIVLLIFLSQDHMGVQGETPTVFSSVGRDATLPCRNVVYPDCSSTTWLYLRFKAAVELFVYGKINPAVATHRAKRLSLVSDCSLYITDVTTEDAGLYICQQYLRKGGPQHGEDADVYLSVLQGVIPTTSSTSVLKSSPRIKTVTTASSNSGPSASGASSDCYSSSHSSVVHVAVRVATTISLFVAVIIVAVIYRMRSGDPQGKPNTSAHSVYSAAASQSL